MSENINFKSDTLAYYLQQYYGIIDASANYPLSPKEIKLLEGKIVADKIPKAFRLKRYKRNA